MFPNPQDALPLPARPSLEQYKKRAKSLAQAVNSTDPTALHDWTTNWVHSLIKSSQLTFTTQPVSADHWITNLEDYFRRLKGPAKLPLTKAQFILARAHGFSSWPKFSRHLGSLASNTAVSNFERAADAIITGDLPTLQSLLRKNPNLIRARSTREHRATLLHYVSANGVESYRQKTPPNIVAIAQLLLDTGAEVDATADVYGGGATALNLTATSIHPERAGVQLALLDLLLHRGADPDKKDDRGISTTQASLANGRPQAAEFLANRGAHLDPESAAGLGRLAELKEFFAAPQPPSADQQERALIFASEYGHNQTVEFLLDRGVPINSIACGQTPLHAAVIGAHLDTVKLLLARGASRETKNAYGGTPLGQAHWSQEHSENPRAYTEIIKTLTSP